MKQQSTRSISLGSILWVAGMLAMAIGTGKPVQAVTINYIIHNNGGLYDTGAPTLLSVTGGFTFELDTKTFSKFNVTFTGDSAIAGTYTDTSNPYLDSMDGLPLIVFEGPSADGRLVNLRLKLSGSGDPYEILEGYYLVSGDTYLLLPNDGRNRPTIVGTLGEPPAAVPEPSTWAMVLGALAGVAVWISRAKQQMEV